MLEALKNLPHKSLALGLLAVVLIVLYFQPKRVQPPVPEEVSQPESQATDSLVLLPGIDSDMQAAFIKARTTLNDFLALAESPPPHTQGYAVKVKFEEGDKLDFFWVYPFKNESGRFSGDVHDVPSDWTTLAEAQNVNFSRSDIVDWTYDNTETETMHGNFSGCVALAKEAPEHASQFKELYGMDCEF